MKIAIIAKPDDPEVSKQLRTAIAQLRASGHHVWARMTFLDHDAARFARGAARHGADLIIAAGGDGTVNEVVNGIIRAGAQPPRLAIVPLGTANDFAKGLQIPLNVPAAMRVALSGVAVPIDIAKVNGRCFVNVSTGGFGPDITESASSKAKKRFGKLAYLFTALRKLPGMQPAHAIFEADGRVIYEGPFFFFAVGNARHTGGGTPVTPRADYSDAQLDLALFTGDKRHEFLTLLPDLRAGRHPEEPDVLYLKAGEFRVRALDHFAVNADGEPIAGKQFHYRLLDQQIIVMRA